METDDTIEDATRVAMTGAASLSRAAEVLIRRSQDAKARQATETARVTEDLQRRTEAQAAAAARYYDRTVEPGWVREADPHEVALAWKGAQQWAQIDPGRFGTRAETLSEQIRSEYGFDPRGPAALQGRAGGLDELGYACEDGVSAARGGEATTGDHTTGVVAEAQDARARADHLTGCDPQVTADQPTGASCDAQPGCPTW